MKHKILVHMVGETVLYLATLTLSLVVFVIIVRSTWNYQPMQSRMASLAFAVALAFGLIATATSSLLSLVKLARSLKSLEKELKG